MIQLLQKINKIILSLFVVVLFSSSSAYAALSATVSLVPENPEPKSTVTLTLDSYSFNVNTAIITWKINNTVVLKGEGEKTFTLKTGNVGEQTEVIILAETADGSSVEESVTITPSSVVLLYEAPQSYVPLLYEGRSLPSDGGLIQVTAFPQLSDNGVPVPASSLSYAWYVNDSVFKAVSGLGKQSATIRLDYLKSRNDIKVVIRSPLGNKAEKTIAVYPHAIMPLLYTYDQILGSDFTSLVGKRFEATQDFTLSLEPFYVSKKEDKEPTYNWFIDGLPSTPLDGRTLSLHPKENSYGTKMLSILVNGPDKRIQKAETKTELIFDTRKQ